MKASRFFVILASVMLMASCGGNAAKENTSDSTAAATETTAVENDEFYATQPVHSGIYIADSYDITGERARKGKYDGRIIFTLSPATTSAFYVYENGNRAKINYKVILKHPFEKGDSGIYRTVDTNDLPVTIATDSTEYYLSFQKNNHSVKIGFDSKPKNSTNAFEALEDMNKELQKNK